MIPVFDGGLYINGLLAVRLNRSVGRRGSSGDGYAMFAYNCRPLGWIDNGRYLIECVTAGLLMDGKLTPQWEKLSSGIRLIHPRYVLDVKQTSQGWVPTISDELLGRSHSLKTQDTCVDAASLLYALLGRRVGRERPSFDLQQWLGDCREAYKQHRFQLALDVIGPKIAALIRDDKVGLDQWGDQPPPFASKLASIFDNYYCVGFDALPLTATALATYIKTALIDLYRGANSVVISSTGSTVMFTAVELAAFRERFRRSPMTDEDYLSLVQKHFVSPLRGILRRKHRFPKNSFQPLRPGRDRNDYPMIWPWPLGQRLFDVRLGPAL